MRIEQPRSIKAMVFSSSVMSFRRAVRPLWPRVAVVCSLASLMGYGWLMAQASLGKSIAAWQWAGALCMGPLIAGVVSPWSIWLGIWVASHDVRYAEIRGGRIRLGASGYSLRPGSLVHCKIEPDPHFGGLYHLCFCFKTFRYGRPLHWIMMVEDLEEASRFQREVERFAFESP